MTKVLDYILTKFPDHRTKIIELYNKDDDFKTLCEDYLTSVESLEKSRLNVIKDREFEGDFLHAYVELEKEIIQLLETQEQKK